MLDILLVNPFADLKNASGMLKEFLVPMPPINLAYLGAALEKEGLAVAIHDDFLAMGDDRQFEEILKRDTPAVVGFPTYTCSLMYRVEELVRMVRTMLPASKVVMGNVHAAYFYQELLQSQAADFVVLGEGELTLPELVRAIRAGTDYSQISGIAFLGQKGVEKTAPRDFIQELDTLSFPAWHLLPIERYNTFFFAKIKKKALLISGSRGCPYKCSFCSLFIQGDRRRVRSVKNIVDEIEFFHQKYGIEQFSFVDPGFPWGRKEGLLFCDEVIARGLHRKIVWITETRVDLIDAVLAQKMAEAGCRLVMFGIESAEQDNLNRAKKNFKVSMVEKAVAYCHDAGLDTTGFFIIGFPDETVAQVFGTMKMAIRLGVTYAKFAVFVPYPGTPVYQEMLKNQGLLKKRLTNWNAYTSYPTRDNTPVVKYSHLSARWLGLLQYWITFRFYFRPRQILKIMQALTLRDGFTIALHFLRLFAGPILAVFRLRRAPAEVPITSR